MGLNIPPDLNAPGAAGLPGHVGQEHEFDIMENEVFSGLAGWMAFVGIVLAVLGGLYSLLGLLSLPYGILAVGEGVCLLLMGIWLFSASRSFKQIVTTSGMDMTLLMHALRKLRSVFTLWGILLIIALVLIAIVVFLSIGASRSSMM